MAKIINPENKEMNYGNIKNNRAYDNDTNDYNQE